MKREHNVFVLYDTVNMSSPSIGIGYNSSQEREMVEEEDAVVLLSVSYRFIGQLLWTPLSRNAGTHKEGEYGDL